MQLKKIAAVAASVIAAIAVSCAAQSASILHGPTTLAAPTVPVQPPAGSASLPASIHSLERADLEAWLDGLVPYALKSGDIAGGVVVVVKDGRVLLEKGYGYADVGKKRPMDPERTMVRIGSTSKLFTWTAVMQLVEQHKLNLDTDINNYLDFQVPGKDGRAITLRDLMNHRAGFEEGLKDILSSNPQALESTEQYLKLHPRPLLFAPGEVPAYSNYGASLAGYIVQRVSGEPFEEYVERHIFQPLGMAHSTFVQPLPQQFRSAVSLGYPTASAPPHAFELVVTRPAGSVTTTADDMSRFMIAHLQMGRFGDQQILDVQTAKLMQTPSESALPDFATMAHGLFHDFHNGRVVIGHGGDTVVFHTEFDLLPSEGVGIYYTFNSRGKNDAVYGLRAQLFDKFMDRYFPAPASGSSEPTLASAAKDAPQMAGLYQSSRRVEHGFISFFYLLQQTAITANSDGTINAPGEPGLGGHVIMHEVAPQIWREVGGTHELALRTIGGVKTVIDSADPISVLQAVPLLRSSSLNLPVLLASIAILVWTLFLWPLSPLLRRGDRAQIGVSSEIRRLRLFLRGAAVVDVVYILAWTMLLSPLLNTQLEVYSFRLDSTVRALQIAGLAVDTAALVGLWACWSMFRRDAPWLSRVWSIAVSAALLGIVWIGVMGNLMSFTLNY